MLQFIRNIMSTKNDEGASAVEYGLLVAGIAAAIVVAVIALGSTVNDTFTDVDNKIAPAEEAG